MAKVLIQEGVQKYEQKYINNTSNGHKLNDTENFRSSLEKQRTTRLKGAPKRLKFFRAN